MKIFTIGFTRKPASTFFPLLKQSGVSRLVDVRLNNVSQLSGFAKREDLRYFLKTICKIDYLHVPDLAPTADLLDSYRKSKIAWPAYELQFLSLLQSRQIESTLSPGLLDNSCLLCSEEKPDYCHRRLAAEYLQQHWQEVVVEHLF